MVWDPALQSVQIEAPMEAQGDLDWAQVQNVSVDFNFVCIMTSMIIGPYQ